MSYDYLLTLCLILVSTKLLSLLTGKFQLPQVVGALLAGLLLGPACFGVLQPSDFLSMLAELGVIVIMFSAGMGTSIKDLKESGKAGFVVALVGVVVPLGLGALLMYCFEPSTSVLTHVFMGAVLTATSVSITVETLKEIGKLNTKVGNTILAAALIDDILGLLCLTVITSLSGAKVSIVVVLIKILLFFIFVAAMGVAAAKVFDWYARRVNERDLHRFPVLAFALCLFMAWAAESVFGVADIIGAFAAGVVIASTSKGSYIASKFNPLSYLFLTPIFFANIGLKVTLPALTPRLILFTLLLVLVSVVSKLIGCGLGARACGFTNRQSVQIGMGMVCRGEVALIVANKGMALNMLQPEYFGSLIIMVIFCAMVTPVLLKIVFKGEKKYEGLQGSRLVDNYELGDQVEIVTEQLLRKNEQSMKK